MMTLDYNEVLRQIKNCEMKKMLEPIWWGRWEDHDNPYDQIAWFSYHMGDVDEILSAPFSDEIEVPEGSLQSQGRQIKMFSVEIRSYMRCCG